MCEHQTITVTKEDKFILCSECNELFFDALSLDNARREANGEAAKGFKRPTAANVAKAASEGAARAIKANLLAASNSTKRYQHSYTRK